jgi:hypothetical protein
MGWLTVLPKLLPVITMAIGAVERMSSKKGRDKQDEAVSMVAQFAPLLGGGLDLDMLLDPDVEKAVREYIDATVNLQNKARDARAKRLAA